MRSAWSIPAVSAFRTLPAFRIRALAALLFAAGSATEVVADETSALLPEPNLIRRFHAAYPLRALDRNLEGWVELAFTISADGSTRDVTVLASAPPRIFDTAAATAVAKWRYEPPGADRRHSAFITFALLEAGASRTRLIQRLSDASRQIDNGQLPAASAILDEISNIDDLTLIERGLIERVAGLYSFAVSDFADAASHLGRAAQILGPHIDPKSLSGLARLLIMARINASQFLEAVRDFERWSPRTDGGLNDMAPTIEKILDALRSGRPLRLTPGPAQDAP